MTGKKFSIVVISMMVFTIQCFAQEKSEFNISLADRTEETGLLDNGQWQVETGYIHTKFQKGSSSEIGQLFLRHGISKKIEIRVLIEDGNGRDQYMSDAVQSTFPLSLGAKYKLLENHSFLPDMTLVGYLQVPATAHNKTQTLYWSPILFMAFQHKFGDKWSVNYNAGAQQEAVGTTWSAMLNGSVHYKIIEPLEVFTEYYAQYEPQETAEHNVGTGLTWQANNHLAFHAAAGTSIFDDEGNHFYSVGASIRFP